MVEFQIREHLLTEDNVIDIVENGILLGCIYPTDSGIKVTSKFRKVYSSTSLLDLKISFDLKTGLLP